MEERFPCPYLGGEVELTDERGRHVVQKQPDLWPAYAVQLATVLADPDSVGTRGNDDERGFVRWFRRSTTASTSLPLSVRTGETMVQ